MLHKYTNKKLQLCFQYTFPTRKRSIFVTQKERV
jgi:hypothetical protein